MREYLEIIKPKQTILLTATALVSYFVAYEGKVELWKMLISVLSIFLAIAGTTAVNMVFDADVDMLMRRTLRRPIPSGRMSKKLALIYGTSLLLTGTIISTTITLLLTLLLLLGFFFDIFVYTIGLKRRTPLSIILGGIAGAIPSLAGWAAAGRIGLEAFMMSLIVFLWIPAHIWYLAYVYEEDYRKAGIPMLPLVVGMRKTSWIIVLSTALMLVAVAYLSKLLSVNQAILGLAVAFTIILLTKSIFFAFKPSRSDARKMYKLASVTIATVYLSIFAAVLV